MKPWEIIGLITATFAGLGIFAGGVGYLWSMFRGGADSQTKFWKEQVDGYKSMIAEKDARTSSQINDLSRQVGELRGQLNEKTNQAKEYLEILQNRNPEMQKFMETLTAVAQQSQQFMKENVVFQKEQAGIMEEIRASMANINTRLEAVDKDFKIEATVSKAA